MERARLIHYIRIAVTALSVTACVLLIALWVRSYRYVDTIFPSTPFHVALKSQQGQISIGINSGSWIPPFIHGVMGIDSSFATNDHSWSVIEKLPGDRRLLMPHWPFALSFALLAAIPWLLGRFSLRTLLIATTLVAVGLALIIVGSR